MEKTIFTFLTLMISTFSIYAQNEETVSTEQSKVRPVNKFIYFVPQYLFIDGTRMEFEYRKNPSHAFLFSGTVYTGALSESSLLGDSDDKWFGANAEVLHKIYLADALPQTYKYSNQIYLAHGPYYQHATVTYKGYGWKPSTIDDLNVLQYQEGEQTLTIDKIGYSAILGVQIVTESRLTIDLYTGLGFRHSFTKKTAPDDNKTYNDTWLTPAYSGNILLLGIKIGVAF